MSLADWKRVLVFGAHVDDEIIGPGGTLALLSDRGARITVVTFTGSDADTGYARPELKGRIGAVRRREAHQVDEILGIGRRLFLGYPLQDVPNRADAYQRCVRIIRQVRPHLILTHWSEDKHRDHRAVAALTDEARWKAAENVLPDLGAPWYTPDLLFYEITELFPHPSLVVDITPTFDRKLAAMESCRSQLEVLPGILDYIRGLALVRGFSRGSRYAEAFLRSNLLPARC